MRILLQSNPINGRTNSEAIIPRPDILFKIYFTIASVWLRCWSSQILRYKLFVKGKIWNILWIFIDMMRFGDLATAPVIIIYVTSQLPPPAGQTNFLLSENLIEIYLINKSPGSDRNTFDLRTILWCPSMLLITQHSNLMRILIAAL